MSTFKKTKVVMLTTNEKASLKLGQNGLLVNNTLGYDAHFTNQHLYFLSNEEIKEGDWVLCMFNEVTEIVKVTTIVNNAFDSQKGFGYGLEYCKKIIATTDKSLFTETKSIGYTEDRARVFYGKEYLPQPSTSFIEKFVEEYNKENQITEVLVEYHEDIYFQDELQARGKLKINPKDNTITIRKAKDSWNREEVVLFAEKYARMVQEKEIQLNGYKAIHNHKWIEENL